MYRRIVTTTKKKKFYSYTEFKIVRISAYHLCISPVRNFSPENKIEWSHSHILWVFFLFFFFYNNIFFFSPRWLILLKPNVSYKNNITSRQHQTRISHLKEEELIITQSIKDQNNGNIELYQTLKCFTSMNTNPHGIVNNNSVVILA